MKSNNSTSVPSMSQLPSSTNSSSFRVIRYLFLVALSLLTSVVILSELFLSYPEFLLSLTFQDASKEQSIYANVTLDNLEWHTRAQSSALAVGAYVFVWYKTFGLALELVARAWRFLRCRNYDSESIGHVDLEEKVGVVESAGNWAEPELHCRDKESCGSSRVYVMPLLAVIIINDSIYNRSRELTPFKNPFFSSDLPLESYSWVLGILRVIPPGAFTRFISMASRALYIFAFEVSVSFLVLYGMAYYLWNRSNISLPNSNPRPGSGWPESQSGTTSAQSQITLHTRAVNFGVSASSEFIRGPVDGRRSSSDGFPRWLAPSPATSKPDLPRSEALESHNDEKNYLIKSTRGTTGVHGIN